MRNPYRYPQTRHTRTRTPPQYLDYRRYKPDLQIEFSAQCVYCRALDRVKGYEAFGVDHYRPQRDFPQLATEYLNLFYACNRCNYLKRRFFPNAHQKRDGVFIPNPCEHVMFEHLRYMGGEIRAHSRAGEFTVGRLDLNDPKVVEFRNGMINILSLAFSKMDEVKRTLQEAQTILDDAGATKEDKDVARAAYDEATKQVAQLQRAIDGFLG